MGAGIEWDPEIGQAPEVELINLAIVTVRLYFDFRSWSCLAYFVINIKKSENPVNLTRYIDIVRV